jgi:hypothetical protein
MIDFANKGMDAIDAWLKDRAKWKLIEFMVSTFKRSL